MSVFQNTHFKISRPEHDPIATLSFAMASGVNTVGVGFADALQAALDWLEAQPELRGVILDSAHPAFCFGADLDAIAQLTEVEAVHAFLDPLNAAFRRLETSPWPVATVLTGSVLGGGYEFTLATHRRFALADPRIRIGLPETGLGLIPGAGGTQRLPRLIGFKQALDHILKARPATAEQAQKIGLVDALLPDRDSLYAAARQWLLDHPETKQPWDLRGAAFPGPAPDSLDARNFFTVAAAQLYERHANTAPQLEAAMSAIQEGAALQLDSGVAYETQHFARLLLSPEMPALLRSRWFLPQEAKREARALIKAHPFAGTIFFTSDNADTSALAELATKAGLSVAFPNGTTDRSDAVSALPSDTQLVIITGGGTDAETQNFPGLAEYAGPSILLNPPAEQVNAEQAPNAIRAYWQAPQRWIELLSDQEIPAPQRALFARLGLSPIAQRGGPLPLTQRLQQAYLGAAEGLLIAGYAPALIENAAHQAGFPETPLRLHDRLHTPFQSPALAAFYGGDAPAQFYREGALDPEALAKLPQPNAEVAQADPEHSRDAIRLQLLQATAGEAAKLLESGQLSRPQEIELTALQAQLFPPHTGGPLAWLEQQG